jgi:Tfp pilus assembly protein PilW
MWWTVFSTTDPLQKRIRSQSGFSLVELVVVGVLAALLSGVLYVVFSSSQAGLASAERQLRLQQMAVAVKEIIEERAHNAGYALKPSQMSGTNVTLNPNPGTEWDSTLILARTQDGGNVIAWEGLAVSDSGLLMEIHDSSATWGSVWPDLNSSTRDLTSFSPLTLGPNSLYVSNPAPFQVVRSGLFLVVDLGYLYLDAARTDSIPVLPFKVRCQFRS